MRPHKLAAAVAMAFTLAGCIWSDDTPSYRDHAPRGAATGAQPDDDGGDAGTGGDTDTGAEPDVGTDPSPVAEAPRYYLLASDSAGYVNVLSATAAATSFTYRAALPVPNLPGAPSDAVSPNLGAIILRAAATPSALVVLRDGLIDPNEAAVGGGYGLIDLGQILADANAAPAVDVQSLASQLGGGARLSYISQALAETQSGGSSSHVWLLNDGPSVAPNASAAERTAARKPDSVFRVNWDASDSADDDGPEGRVDDAFGAAQEIMVGDGRKDAAIAAIDASTNYVFVHNNAARSVSVIDNVPTSPTFQQVVRTVDLGTGRKPSGMAFSPVSGHVYVGIPDNKSVGLAIIDAKLPPAAMAARFVRNGTAAGQIPGIDRFAVSADGRWVIAGGYQAPSGGLVGQGFVAVIDAALADAVAIIKPLGDMKPGKIEVAAISVDGAERLRLFVASEQGGANDQVVAVVDFDPAAGALTGSSALTIGPAGGARQSALSVDQRWAFFSVAGHCDASEPPADSGSGADSGAGDGVAVGDNDGGDAGTDGGTGDAGAGGGGTGGIDLGGIDIGLALARARSVDVGVDIGIDPGTDPGVDTGNDGATDGGTDGGSGSSDPGGAAVTPATCATIVPVAVATQTVGAPIRTVGDSVRGLAVYVAQPGENSPDAPAPDDGGDTSNSGDAPADDPVPADDGGTTPDDSGDASPPADGAGEPTPGDTSSQPPAGGAGTPPDATDDGPSFDDIFR